MPNLRLRPRLVCAFLTVGLIPLVILGVFSIQQSGDALEEAAFNQLVGVRDIKKGQIEQFFAERQGDMSVLTETTSTLRADAFSKLTAVQMIKTNQIQAYLKNIEQNLVLLAKNSEITDALSTFDSAWQDMGAGAGERLQRQYITENPHPIGERHKLNAAATFSAYNKAHGKYHPWLRELLEARGYYDVFLVNRSGDVVYSVYKEADFATNLKNGEWKDTDLAKVYHAVEKNFSKDKVAFTDFAPYEPSAGAPASFLAAPVFGDDGRGLGALIFQMPIDRINAIMGERTGLGKTGETYMVGPDKLMRSDSYLDPEFHSVKASFANPNKGAADTEAVRLALDGKSGSKVIIDYNGNPVLSAYAPIDVFGITWAVLAEIDVAEAFVPIDSDGHEFYAKYIEQYGYYDLFVISSDGHVFYTVTKEADYQTNMVDGKYASSGLGKLVRKTLQTKSYNIVDFAPYAPSNNAPAAFIAQPIVHDGEVELVVALQLSLDAINKVMQQRGGMGATGETYLVGSDYLMRSDSFLDPDNHSVTASFERPETGKVETDASRAALSGETGQGIIIDYNGNPVLSAYTPLSIGDQTWALIAEVDEAEAFEVVNNKRTVIIVIVLIGAGVIVAVGYFLARGIASPVVAVTQVMNELESGNLDVVVPYMEKQDELGEMAVSVEHFKEQMKQVKDLERKSEEQKQKMAEQRKADMNDMANNFEANVGNIVGTVTSAATELEAASSQMASVAKDNNERATIVAAASVEASSNMETVTSAITKLMESQSGVSRHVQQSVTVAHRAAEQATKTGATVENMVEAVGEVGDVVELITNIAEQTNLLALNATIEAARAGEAGKGFAVVASEVKNLANQTAKATEQISGQITHVQSVTQEAADAIESIGKTITEIDEIANAITSAVENQTTVTDDISQSVDQVSEGTREVSSNIVLVEESTGETESAAGQIASASSDLSVQAENLNKEMSNFISQVRKD